MLRTACAASLQAPAASRGSSQSGRQHSRHSGERAAAGRQRSHSEAGKEANTRRHPALDHICTGSCLLSGSGNPAFCTDLAAGATAGGRGKGAFPSLPPATQGGGSVPCTGAGANLVRWREDAGGRDSCLDGAASSWHKAVRGSNTRPPETRKVGLPVARALNTLWIDSLVDGLAKVGKILDQQLAGLITKLRSAETELRQSMAVFMTEGIGAAV